MTRINWRIKHVARAYGRINIADCTHGISSVDWYSLKSTAGHLILCGVNLDRTKNKADVAAEVLAPITTYARTE